MGREARVDLLEAHLVQLLNAPRVLVERALVATVSAAVALVLVREPELE